MRPRDLYDIIHLFNDSRWDPNRALVLEVLKKKCIFKSVELPTLELINTMPEKADLLADWHNMLAHQIYDLEPPEYYWEKLPLVFSWLYNN